MLLLSRAEISKLMNFADYVRVVEGAFRLHADGCALEPALAHVEAEGGEFHIKAGGLKGEPPYFALKVNGGFFQNRARFQLPNIQGLIVLSRADNGVPLAAMDSIEVTIQRTGAATAVAAKYLARSDSQVCMVCGCGAQGRVQLRALCYALPIRRALAWSRQEQRARTFAEEMSKELGIAVEAVTDLGAAACQSDVVVTGTPARGAFFMKEYARPGMFIAAVGADSPDKQEIDPHLLACARIVADLRGQAVKVGDTHHAIEKGLIRADAIHAELGEIITGRQPGRQSSDEIFVFDSTGTALQDVAAASAVYERAMAAKVGLEWLPS